MNAEIKSCRVYPDFSGAHAVVVVRPFWGGPAFHYACDLLGRENVQLVHVTDEHDGYPFAERARFRALAVATYRREVTDRLSPAWLAKNAAIYAEESTT